jgi:hypothetical protein
LTINLVIQKLPVLLSFPSQTMDHSSTISND